ncbi:MAG: N-acetylmuramoyl-L-alanine amidase [Candidatus Hydrogenedentes bacterium]|nr:N-acetylmuramoyl-L-alanine amidase [Candidatus Hydrogenedentota bacterium]
MLGKVTVRRAMLAFCAITVLAMAAASAEDIIRKPIASGAWAIMKHGRTLGLEVHPPKGTAARSFLKPYLQVESDWTPYQSGSIAFIPYSKLKPVIKRDILFAVFPKDTVDTRGWVHTVLDGRETLWSLSEWITGTGSRYKSIMSASANRITSTDLRPGQIIVIPRAYLSETMRRASAIERPESYEPNGELRYASDSVGEYAIYTLKRGEAIYTSVVVRFTDFTDNEDILEACEVIARRSKIRNVRDIVAGQKIYIPTYLLSNPYLPKGSAGREHYEASVSEARRIRVNRAHSRDLSDVVVILDAGHGGTDTGAKHIPSGLYEDEINYDIVARIVRLLEQETGATVYTTVVDTSRPTTPTDRRRFSYDKDEYLKTTPPYKNDGSASVSANLRWMLVNAIYDKELKRGVDPEKVVFTSIHTDSLYNANLRGAMIYTPGARYRRSEEIRKDKIYAMYAEGRHYNSFSSTSKERRRDEALSLNFAEILLENLGRKRIKRHDQGAPIRSQIRQGRNRVYVPAVLRNTKVPTKILVETANLKNRTDRKRLADPWWRQQFAIAYVAALKEYYGVSTTIRTAKAH